MVLLEAAIAAFMLVAGFAIAKLYITLRDVSDVTLVARATEARINTELSEVRKEIRGLRDQVAELANEVRLIKIRGREGAERSSVEVGEVERIVESLVRHILSAKESYGAPPREEAIPAPRRAPRQQGRLSSTEMRVLSMLTEPKTYKDIVEALGVTREHAARTLKKLHEMGYVVRDTSKRPYTYVRVKS